VVAVLGFALLGVGFAPAASAAVVDCPPMSSNVCKDLRPVAECYWRNSNGTVSVVWGWNNPRSDTARVAVGSHNNVSPGPDDQGQPTLFAPGRHQNAFVTVTSRSADEVEWRLGNRTESVDLEDLGDDEDIERCETKPVPQVGSVGALLFGALVLALGVLTVASARPRRIPVVAR
jgi:hypothetical protein